MFYCMWMVANIFLFCFFIDFKPIRFLKPYRFLADFRHPQKTQVPPQNGQVPAKNEQVHNKFGKLKRFLIL
jgi:hypothetical protein